MGDLNPGEFVLDLPRWKHVFVFRSNVALLYVYCRRKELHTMARTCILIAAIPELPYELNEKLFL